MVCPHLEKCHFYEVHDATYLHGLFKTAYCDGDPASCQILWLSQEGVSLPLDMWPDGEARDADQVINVNCYSRPH